MSRPSLSGLGSLVARPDQFAPAKQVGTMEGRGMGGGGTTPTGRLKLLH